MGVLASAVLANGGFVTGVVPRQLSYQELAHEGLSRLYEVDTMHERKHLMQQLSRAASPCPAASEPWRRSSKRCAGRNDRWRLHEKPCVFANLDGYYDHLFEFLDHAEARGLLLPENRALARQAPNAVAALQTIRTAWAEAEQAILDMLKAYAV